MNQKTCDSVIIGAGLSGLLTTYILSKEGINVVLVDKSDFTNPKNQLLDFRTTAISEGSKIFFEKIGFWKKIHQYSQPIQKIKVFDRNQASKIEFKNPDKTSFLGYIIKNNYIKKILIKSLIQKKNVYLIPNSRLTKIQFSNDFITSKTHNTSINSKLLIAADGKNSFVRKFVKTPIYSKDYKHKAFVLNLFHDMDHKKTAYELFFKTGPLAILPMKSNYTKKFCSSIIWSDNSEYLNSLQNVNNNLLKSIIEEKIQYYVGNVLEIIDKKVFSLSAHINSSFYDKRLVYIGDAAHSIHPIAGQGWNVGVRDIENLLNSIRLGMNLGLDIGSEFICKNYNDNSFNDAFLLYQITDKLNTIFMMENFFIKNIRKSGFSFIDNNNKINNFISSFAMGKLNLSGLFKYS